MEDKIFYVLGGMLPMMLIWGWAEYRLHQMMDLCDEQHALIDFQDGIIHLQELLYEKHKQEKCYGSTAVSKTAGEGSTPSSCANIMEELVK